MKIKNTSKQLNDLAEKLENNLNQQLQEEYVEDAIILRQLLKMFSLLLSNKRI